jgi:hypothetical protein
MMRASLDAVRREVAKCDLVCSNCHRIRTWITRRPRAPERTDYARRRRFLDALKARPCADCDGSYPPCVMDFDHRPGVEKVSNVSQLVWKDRALLLAEVAKCDLICSNCHRMRTHHRQHGEAA